jgi:phosphatidylinositol alpha-1,6-mannosyltransferase
MTTLYMLICWAIELLYLCYKNRPDCIFIGQIDLIGGLGLLLDRLLGVPYVAFTHGEDLTKRKQVAAWRRRLREATCLKASKVVANSSFTVEELINLGVSRERIALIPPGVDAQRFTPQRDAGAFRSGLAPHGEKLLLTVGRLTRRKGHALVISALPRVLQVVPSLRYVIVGPDWGEREKLEELIEELDLQKEVVFLGRVGDEELPHIYSACDLFVMANYEPQNNLDTEGFGIVFLEANACGKPVIGGQAGGVADAVVHGETGLLVDATDPDELSSAIIRLLTDESYARRLGRKGRQRVLERFSWDRAASAVREVGLAAARANGNGD